MPEETAAQQRERTIYAAKCIAQGLREMFNRLTPIERAVGAKYIEAVSGLVTAVERI